MGWLMPDYMFDHYYDITPAFLADAGIRALLIDIDNTLAPYEMPEPDEQIIRWLGQLADAGVKAALVFVVFMICIAVCFVKQHSALDVVAALPLCLLAECVTFGKCYWRPKLRSRTS